MSSCYSLELCIQRGIFLHLSFAFTSRFFTAICKPQLVFASLQLSYNIFFLQFVLNRDRNKVRAL